DHAVADAQPREFGEKVATERIVADPRHEFHIVSVPCGRDRDVRRSASEILAEGAHLLQSDTVLEWIQIHAEAPDSENVRGAAHRHAPLPSSFVLTISHGFLEQNPR